MEECPVFAGHFYYFSTNEKKYSLKMLPYAKKSGIIEVLMCNAPSEMDEQSNAMGEETIMDVRPADLLLCRRRADDEKAASLRRKYVLCHSFWNGF